jgi:hypothetical protein
MPTNPDPIIEEFVKSIKDSEVEKEVEKKVFNYLEKEIKKGKLPYEVKRQIKVGPYVADIVVFDQNGKIREVYEVKADSEQGSLQHATEVLSHYFAYLGTDVKYFIAFRGEDGEVKILQKSGSDLIKTPTYEVAKKEKVVDELKYASFFIAAITAIVLISSIIGWIQFNAVELSLYVIFIGSILLPYAQEINIFNLIKFKKGSTKTKK